MRAAKSFRKNDYRSHQNYPRLNWIEDIYAAYLSAMPFREKDFPRRSIWYDKPSRRPQTRKRVSHRSQTVHQIRRMEKPRTRSIQPSSPIHSQSIERALIMATSNNSN